MVVYTYIKRGGGLSYVVNLTSFTVDYVDAVRRLAVEFLQGNMGSVAISDEWLSQAHLTAEAVGSEAGPCLSD